MVKLYAIATLASTLVFGCGDIGAASTTAASSGGGDDIGSATVTSSSASSGSGGSGGSGGLACLADDDCGALNDPLLPCWVGLCVHNVCDRMPHALGTPCDDHNPALVCDGVGQCREVFEYAGACYARPDGAFPEPCPTCDDGDPCTVDSCVKDACVHDVLPEGHMCGPWFTCQAGQCCPHPDTIQH